MKCHYEVLDVNKDADDSEIKTAYRKLALKWHPDKNLDTPHFAKEQFQLVQQAYEVLSDRQERAWYDNHREQILRGANSDFQDHSLDVFQYFTTTCFKGYGDDDQSFYSIYRNVFENIAKEDMDFIDEKEEFCEYPSFGYSSTDYDKVSEFYAFWLNYSTKKSYVWLDPHDIKDMFRKYVKIVEKENKKVRLKAKKERNEEVRNLVAFVRKRDKRVQAQKKLQEQKLKENKKKMESHIKEKRLRRLQELNNSENQPEWTKFDNVETELAEIERHLAEQFGEEFSNSEDETQGDFHNVYCLACNKVFKTTKAFQNHESSKKHRENVDLLKENILEDDIQSTESGNSRINENLEEVKDSDKQILEQDLFEDLSCDEFPGNLKSKKKKKKSRNILLVDDVNHESITNMHNESDDNLSFETNKKQKRRNIKSSKIKPCSDSNGEIKTCEEPVHNTKNLKKYKKKIASADIDFDTNHNCVTCKSNFTSKNKLFDHLKKTGHGVYIPGNVKNKNKLKGS